MEKTILQNMYNFNEPKVALVLRKDSKGCYDFVELNGYIVEMVYNEHGAFIKSRTFFIDKSETVNPGVEKVIEYIPRTLTVDQVVDILERLRETITLEELDKRLEDQSNYSIEGICYGLSDYYNTYYGSVNFTQRLNELGINIKYPENLYSENTTLGYTIIVKKESDMLRITAISEQYHGIGNFEEYRSLFYYDLNKTVDSGKLIECVTDKVVSYAI